MFYFVALKERQGAASVRKQNASVGRVHVEFGGRIYLVPCT